jgi:4-hydroxybenzoate polyprenyltransferase
MARISVDQDERAGAPGAQPASLPAPLSTRGKLPLVVDMDGFLVRADLSAEAIVIDLETTVSRMSRAIRGDRRGIPPEHIAEYARKGVDVSGLPLQPDLVDYIIACAETGRELHLVTSAAQEIAEAVATRVGGFASATGAEPGQTMANNDKLALVQRRFPDGFAYAGRAPQLLAEAKAVVIARRDTSIERSVAARGTTVETRVDAPSASLRTWVKALRCHQWSKNALVLVPLILGHAFFDVPALLACLAGFCLLSVLASGTYLINDILDLDSDRRHPTKRNRPLARGDIPMTTALVVAGAAILGSLSLALALSQAFFLCLCGYLVTTLAYSLYLKRMLLVDVFVLAVLFTSRIAMGIALAGVEASPWLLTFTMFFFLSLSLAKRHVEVVNAGQAGQTNIPGRDYRASDLPLTVALGVGCNAVAMLVLFLYLTNEAMPTGFYRQPYWLWGAAFIVFLWSLRIWGLSHRGKLDADPVAFAIRDRTSIALGIIVLCVFGLSI